MQKTIYECDNCGARCQFNTIFAKVDRRMDGAGSMETVYENVDLCIACAHHILSTMVEKMDYAQAKEWLSLVRSKPK